MMNTKQALLTVILCAVSFVLGMGIGSSDNDAVIETIEPTAVTNEAVLEAVSRLIVVPNEEPVFSVVTDPATLQGEQAFYRNTQAGDVLLIFPLSAQAMIYRPTEDRLVNVGPLILEPLENEESATSTEQ